MNGLLSGCFGFLLAGFLYLVCRLGRSGWILGTAAMIGLWLLQFRWISPALAGMEVLAGTAVSGFSFYWMRRHTAWRGRLRAPVEEGSDLQTLQAGLHYLRDQLHAANRSLESGLRLQSQTRQIARTEAWDDFRVALERIVQSVFRPVAWTLYLANGQGELEPALVRGPVLEMDPEDLTHQDPHSRLAGGRRIAVWPFWRRHERIGLLLMEGEASVLEPGVHPVLLLALIKGQLLRELDYRSRVDDLTGLLRRASFERRLQEEASRVRLFQSSFSVALLQVDGFAELVRDHGFETGEEVIHTIAERLKESLYETDVIARYDKETFAILLPLSQPAGLRVKAQLVQRRISDQAFVIGLEPLQVTVSIGLAHASKDLADPAAALAAAEQALRKARTAGTNRLMDSTALVGGVEP